MKNTINSIIIIGLVIISGFTGYSVGNKYINLNNYIEKSDYMKISNKIKTLEKNYQFALENLNRYKKAYNTAVPPIPNEVFLINGEIIKINPSKITVKTPDLKYNTLMGEKSILTNKSILIDKNTKITEINPLKTISENKNDIISIESIKVGDRVIIYSKENIKSKKEFKAKEVSLIKEM